MILILLLAAVLAAATFMESAKGREYAQWYVYKSSWFIALLALLGVNILAATLVRFPWKMRNLGFLITHAGLLAVLASMGLRSKTMYAGALGVYIAGLLAMFTGFTMRTAISGRVPVTNMYESVIYVGLGIAVLGLIFELLYCNRCCGATSGWSPTY